MSLANIVKLVSAVKCAGLGVTASSVANYAQVKGFNVLLAMRLYMKSPAWTPIRTLLNQSLYAS